MIRTVDQGPLCCCIADSTRTSCEVRKVRTGEIATFVSFLAKRKQAPRFVAQRVRHINCEVGQPP
jgi:hypothetical protein